jgi:NAD+ synthase
MEGGKITAKVCKHDLPNYGVYDESRTYAAAPLPEPVSFRGHKIGIMICEDLWHPDVAKNLKQQGAELLLTMNGSVWFETQRESRKSHALARVKETGLPLVYANQVGGQDEIVFDGGCFAMNRAGEVVARTPYWNEEYCSIIFDGDIRADHTHAVSTDEDSDIYQALVTGTRDYIWKNGFKTALLGLSGGIDSALVAAIAADAIGAKNVSAYMLPSPYTSKESFEDADDVAKMLGIQCQTISIEPGMKAIGGMVKADGVAAENIQSRLRGITLMALSNQTGALLLSTGNKSEMATGYATLYGDMCGAFAPLKDVYKTKVFELSRYRKLPERVITKAPTAELRPNQKDEDSLPPYNKLDAILHGLIEENLSLSEITTRGFDADTVNKVAKMLDLSEYKRRQSAPGVKISTRAFGRDRRYPMTNKYNRKDQ